MTNPDSLSPKQIEQHCDKLFEDAQALRRSAFIMNSLADDMSESASRALCEVPGAFRQCTKDETDLIEAQLLDDVRASLLEFGSPPAPEDVSEDFEYLGGHEVKILSIETFGGMVFGVATATPRFNSDDPEDKYILTAEATLSKRAQVGQALGLTPGDVVPIEQYVDRVDYTLFDFKKLVQQVRKVFPEVVE